MSNVRNQESDADSTALHRPVHIAESDIHELSKCTRPLNVSVYLHGLDMHRSKFFVERAVNSIEEADSFASLLDRLKAAKHGLLGSGIFSDVQYAVEPALGGGSNAIVRLNVREGKGRKEIGIQTDMKGKPELKVSMANFVDSACTIAIECMPTKLSEGLTSVASSVRWCNPPYAEHADLALLQGTYDHTSTHQLDKENRQSASISTFFGPSYDAHTFQLSYTSSVLGSSTANNLCDELKHFHQTRRDRVGLQYERVFSKLSYHTYPLLRQLYSLPIEGFETRLRCGLFQVACASLENAASHVARELRVEAFSAFHRKLSPFLTLGLWAKVGYFFPMTAHSSQNPPLYPYILDRYFLGTSHVRGFGFIGPSVYNNRVFAGVKEYASEPKEPLVGPIQQLGSSIFAASSVSLSFPVPLFQGLLAGHIFMNTGFAPAYNQRKFSVRSLVDGLCTSAGGGVLLNQVPGLGVFSSGRLEFNIAIPLLWGEHASIQRSKSMFSRKEVFQKARFGIYWSYE